MSTIYPFLCSAVRQNHNFCKLNHVAGVPRLNTPPLLQPSPVITNQEKQIVAPKPIRTTPNIVTRLEDLSQPWTRSPTKSQMEPLVATWHFTSYDPPHSVSSVVGMPVFYEDQWVFPLTFSISWCYRL